jgi:GH25 family lysozyme M1 (1,4-beta-N-acetylmuramidase)
MSYVRGIDVSAWDPFIDWPMVRSQDIRFVMIKATEGVDFFSKCFNEQWAGAKSAGILRGPYHYLRAAQDGVKQADFFLSKVNIEEGDLPPFLDIEGANNDGGTNSQFIGNAQKWLERVEQKTGRRPVVYSTASFLREKLTVNGHAPGWATNFPIWVAQYFNSHSPDGQPTQPSGWGDWIFWQYSGDKLPLNGVYQDAAKLRPALVDMNIYRHSLEELYQLAKADPSKAKSDPIVIQSPSPIPAPVEQQVVIPPQPAPISVTYTIQSGDTLSAISIKYGITVDDIVQLNNIANPDMIFAGQVIHIPGKKASS